MFGLLKKKQDWSADIHPAGTTIEVKSGDNLLAAALASGLAWPHDCRVGSCGTCRCTLKEGKIKPLADFSYVLDSDQIDSGMILACQTSARSDLVVSVDLLDVDTPMTVSEVCARIVGTTQLTHDILELVVKTDAAPETRYIAGQYAELSIDGIDKPRSYSFARAPEAANSDGREFRFFVRLIPGGEFTEWLFKQDRTDELLKLSGPYGSFWLRPGASALVCVAGGSGLAPLKSLLESAHRNNVGRDVYFLFGARTQRDLYCLEELEKLKNNWTGNRFEFIPVLSEEPDGSNWSGARGLVTDYLRERYVESEALDLSTCQGYLCGPPPMIDAAVDVMNANGLSGDNIFFDKFLDASSMPGGR